MWPGHVQQVPSHGNFARASSAVLVSAVVLLPVMTARRIVVGLVSWGSIASVEVRRGLV